METAKEKAKRLLMDRLEKTIVDSTKSIEGLVALIRSIDRGEWDWLSDLRVPENALVSVRKQGNGELFANISGMTSREAAELAASLLSAGWRVESYETGDYIVKDGKCIHIYLPPGATPWMSLI